MKTDKKEKLIPELRFPEFKEEWKQDRLGKIGSFSKGKNISKKDIEEKGKYPCIRYGELYTHYKEHAKKIISRTNLEKNKLVFSKINDVIIPSSGETAIDISTAVYIDQDNIALGGDLNIMRSPLHGYFLALYLSNKKKYDIARLAQGISVIHLYPEHLKSLKINYPTLPEQQKISSFLSLIDRKIELLNKKKELLEIYKKGVMQKIFNRDIRFKDINGNNYPEWEEKRLGEILQEYVERTRDENQFPILSSTKDGLFLQEEYFNKEIASENNIGYKILRKNQLVFSPQNLWLGNINFNEKYEAGIVSPSYKIFNVDGTKIYPLFLKYIIKLPRMIYEYMTSSEQGASIVRRNLNMDLFKQIKIKVPCKKEQKEIYEYLEKITSLTVLTKDNLKQISLFKKGLLQKMFI